MRHAGIQFAPHGAWDGVLGLAALVQVCATLPENFIAFEYPSGDHDAHQSFWYDILDGLPPAEKIVVDSMVAVLDEPGLGVSFNAKARAYLTEGDEDFLDPPHTKPARGCVSGNNNASGARL